MTQLLPAVATYPRREKANSIEAVQFDGTGENAAQILRWANTANISAANTTFDSPVDTGTDWEIVIRTDDNDTMRARVGDWIAKGALGQFYTLPDDIFQATYGMSPPASVDI